MAACFSLTPKHTPDGDAVNLHDLDIKICELVGQPVHPDKYCLGWFDSIGYWLATGRTWAEIRTMHNDWCTDGASKLPDNEDARAGHRAFYNDLAKIVDWLEAGFIVNHWHQTGK